MVSSDKKLIARAQKRRASQTAGASAAAFNKKQSAFARRSEEERIRDEAVSPFEGATGVTAKRGGPSASASARGMGGRDSSRRSRFALAEETAAPVDSTAAELGALLGNAAPGAAAAEVDDMEQDPKKSKKERFEEVISATRKSRVEIQAARDEKQKETDALDAAFDDVAGLLQKRDKRQEEIDQFKTLGKPEVRALLDEHHGQRAGKAGRKFVLGADGKLTKEATDEEATAAPVATSAPLPPAPPPPPAAAAAPSATAKPKDDAGDDDFDALMGQFKMDLKRAHAVERVLLPEEEAARELHQELLAMDREQRPLDERDKDRTRAEWIEQGGDNAFRMDEDEDAIGQSAPLAEGDRPRQAHAVDLLLGKLEEFCASPPETAAERSKALSKFASDLWHAALKQKKKAEESFKLILIDCQRYMYNKRPLTRFHRVAMYLATKLFPTTDFRHPVVTPLMVQLSSLCMQAQLVDVTSCRAALWHAAMLLNTLAPSNRYAGEPVAVALNVVALQFPRQAIVPTAHGTARGAFPVMDRADGAILGVDGVDAAAQPSPLPLLVDDDDSTADTPAARLDTLAAAYRLLLNAAELYGDSPSFDCIFDTSFVRSFHRIARSQKLHPAIEELHRKVVERVAALAAENTMNRTPLAMRMFRPRPLRQYEPLLGDDTPSEKKEMQLLKQAHRADHKRVMRTLTAEARVEQRGRESERAADEARKKAKLNSIMAELQQQQHIMKTADNLRTKATARKRASQNVVPAGGSGKKRGGGD